jgi:hypothetical protein
MSSPVVLASTQLAAVDASPLSMILGAVTIPVNIGLARGAAPIVLYEIVSAALPLKAVPDAAPAPLLFIVKASPPLPEPQAPSVSRPPAPTSTQSPVVVSAVSVKLGTLTVLSPVDPVWVKESVLAPFVPFAITSSMDHESVPEVPCQYWPLRVSSGEL